MNDPVKTIRVNFHSIQNGTSPGSKGNFEDVPEERAYLDSLVVKINENFATLKSPLNPKTCVCGSSCYLPETRYRIELVNKYYHYDPSRYCDDNTHQGQTHLSDFVSSLGVNTDNVLNVFFVGDSPDGITRAYVDELSHYNNLDFNHGIWVQNHHKVYESDYSKFQGDIDSLTDKTAKSLGNHIFHELGHNLGLDHLYWSAEESYSFDYLDDWFGLGTANCPTRPIPSTDYCCDGGSPTLQCHMNWMGNYCYVGAHEATPMQLGRIHRASRLSAMRKYIKNTTTLHPDHIVSSNETWGFDIRMYENIVVESGNTLTITCNVRMPKGSKVVVEDDATVILDGGKITSWDKDEFWEGIEVEGDNSKSQLPVNNNFEQGVVEMKNGAVIENAHVGINLMKGNDWSTTGGLVFANNSTFRNCRKAIAFFAYQNISSTGNPKESISSINGCSFIIDSDYPDIGQPPMGQVTIFAVDGVDVSNCTFDNQHYAAFDGANALHRGWGMYIIDSKTIITKNEFKNWSFGVTLNQITTNKEVAIEENDFINCFHGISSMDQAFPVITLNSFDGNLDAGAHFHSGLGFEIEENTFKNHNDARGLSFNWTSSYAHQIYLNEFDDNRVSINSQNDSANLTSGLLFKCNDFNNPTAVADINVSSGKIRRFQGSCFSSTSPADNLFSNSCINPQQDFQVYQGYPGEIRYFHHSPTGNSRLIPDCYNTQEIQPNNCGIPNSETCKSRQSIVIGPVDPEDPIGGFAAEFGSIPPSGKRDKINDAKNQLNDLRTDYDNLVDGGSTSELLDDLQSQNHTTAEKTQMLEDHSPYLSSSVLEYVIDNSVISPDDLHNVILLNSPIDTELYENKYDDLDEIFNEEQFGIIDDKQQGLSPRDSLEMDIDRVVVKLQTNTADLLRMYNFDSTLTETNKADSIIRYLKDFELPQVKEILVRAYWTKQDWTKADSIIQSLSSVSEYSNWSQLFSTIHNRLKNGENVWQLAYDESLQSELNGWASDSSDKAYWYARGLIASRGDTNFTPYLDPIQVVSGKKEANAVHQLNKEAKKELHVWPNPTKNTIRVSGLSNVTNAEYSLISNNGAVVKRGTVQDHQSIDVSELPAGIYIMNIHNKNISETHRIVIQ